MRSRRVAPPPSGPAAILPRVARARLFAVALGVAASGPAPGAGVDLPAFLRDVERASTAASMLRADGELEVAATDKTFRAEVVVWRRPPNDAYLEVRQPAFRALILGGGETAYCLLSGAGKEAVFAATAAFAGSDFTREDIEPFRLGAYRDWRISDENESEVTVTLFPKQSSYTQLVTTFDVGRKLPLKTLYYRDTLSNLVKMQQWDYAAAGGRWLPISLRMESFKLHTRSSMTLRWSEDRTPPDGLFEPASLTQGLPGIWTTPGR